MAKHIVENLSDGPRFIHTKSGTVTIPKGEKSAPVELDEGELKQIQSRDFYKVTAATGEEEKAAASAAKSTKK